MGSEPRLRPTPQWEATVGTPIAILNGALSFIISSNLCLLHRRKKKEKRKLLNLRYSKKLLVHLKLKKKDN